LTTIVDFNNEKREIYFFQDLTRSYIQGYLLETLFIDKFHFLLDEDNVTDLHLWLTTYLEGREFNHDELDQWILKFCQMRQKRLNGGY
jgi:hypothetical protein